MDELPADQLAMRLLVGGPSLCLICGRTFQRGGAVDVPALVETPAVCMWCIAMWLQSITGWDITGQMRGWLVSKIAPIGYTWEEVQTDDPLTIPPVKPPPF